MTPVIEFVRREKGLHGPFLASGESPTLPLKPMSVFAEVAGSAAWPDRLTERVPQITEIKLHHCMTEIEPAGRPAFVCHRTPRHVAADLFPSKAVPGVVQC